MEKAVTGALDGKGLAGQPRERAGALRFLQTEERVGGCNWGPDWLDSRGRGLEALICPSLPGCGGRITTQPWAWLRSVTQHLLVCVETQAPSHTGPLCTPEPQSTY